MTLEVADGAHGLELSSEGLDQPLLDFIGGLYPVDDRGLFSDHRLPPFFLGVPVELGYLGLVQCHLNVNN